MYQSVRRGLVAFGQALVFGNGYIALCAVMMCLTTVRLFALHLPDSFLPFVFAGTLGSYSLHTYLTDGSAGRTIRERWIDRHKQTLLGLFMAALVAGLWFLTQLIAYLPDLLPVIFLTFLYTAPKINWRPFRALRRVAVLKTTYLALVWTYVTVAIPLLITTPAVHFSWVVASVWLLNRFLLIYSVALCFDYRDRDVDRQSKWLTIVSMLTERQARLFFGVIAFCFGLTVATLYALGLDEWTLICISLPMILLLLTAQRIESYASDYGYYVYLDGLLMLSGLLLWCWYLV
ncbi:UbiA family prenyltransferase [soil metagenome]